MVTQSTQGYPCLQVRQVLPVYLEESRKHVEVHHLLGFQTDLGPSTSPRHHDVTLRSGDIPRVGRVGDFQLGDSGVGVGVDLKVWPPHMAI